MIPAIIKIIVDVFFEYRNDRNKKRIAILEKKLSDALELAEYRDYVRRYEETRRRKGN